MGKKGFTLIELLVASLLMGMLVTILTMVFNSSSIAWRTGKAQVANMNDARKKIALLQSDADDALPRVRQTDGENVLNYSVVPSAWTQSDTDGTQLRQRGLKSFQSMSGGSFTMQKPYATPLSTSSISRDGASAYAVGVFSAGPDGEWETEDDISSWPEKEQ